MVCSALCVSAQTLHNGVWYSLYDEESHTMNTQGDYETGNVFAPTKGTMHVTWKYEWIDWLGAFAKIDTEVLESANGGSNTNKVGDLAENTGKNSVTNESFSVSRSINWIKFNRTGLPTHKVILQHLDIELAQHILLASGEYGATSGTHDFGTIGVKTVSEAYHVNLRSFLSAGNITVSSSLPEIFHVGAADNMNAMTFAVGSNACASANGTATAASATTLGNIANYGFDLYFTPKEGVTYNGVITITDGVSTAQVNVSGVGYKRPEVLYAYEHSMCEGDLYSDAVFTDLSQAGYYCDTVYTAQGVDSIYQLTLSVHPVYQFEDSLSIREGEEQVWESMDLSVLPLGDTVLVAAYKSAYGCDSVYTLYLNVRPRVVTYGNDTISLCAGESAVYEGKTYRRSIVDSVLVSMPNQFGGDSIVELVVNVYPALEIALSETIVEGDAQNWEGYDLSQYAVGDTMLVAAYTSVHGCDSTYVLYLTVLPNTQAITTTDALLNTPVQKLIINGQLFIRKGDELFDPFGRRVE